MSIQAARRSTMTLYSDITGLHSHAVRIALAEKGVSSETIYVKPTEHVQELADINPYNSMPTLFDRDLVLYHHQIILEYLDERFPHPPLLPVYPVARAHSRLWIHRIERDWYSLVDSIEGENVAAAQLARKELQTSLNSVSMIFEEKPFFLSDDFSMVDCMLAPLFWRLPTLGVEISPRSKGLKNYARRLFDRPCFDVSLSEDEREINLAACA